MFLDTEDNNRLNNIHNFDIKNKGRNIWISVMDDEYANEYTRYSSAGPNWKQAEFFYYTIHLGVISCA